MITLLLIAMFPSAAAANDAVNLSSVPLFSTIVQDNPKYKAASDKAQEAFFKQVGLTDLVAQDEAIISKATQDRVSTAIDKNTPINSRHLYFFAGAGYAVLVKHQVNQRFQNPLFPSVTHTISVGRDNESFSISFPFSTR